MKNEDLVPFVGKKVKLSLHTGFVIKGIIDRISEETIFFSTNQTKSAIDIKGIAFIVIDNNNRGG